MGVRFFMTLLLAVILCSPAASQHLESQRDSLNKVRVSLESQISKVRYQLDSLDLVVEVRRAAEIQEGERLTTSLRSETTVFEEASIKSRSAGVLSAGTQVAVLLDERSLTDAAKSSLWRITTGDIIGYVRVSSFDASDRKTLTDIRNDALSKYVDERERPKRQAREARIRAEFGSSEFLQAIIDKTIKLGMTSDMVIAAWGEPDDRNRTVGSWGSHEQWAYGDTYIYIENGIVTSWQD